MFLRSWTLCALLASAAGCLPAETVYTGTDLGAETLAYGIDNAGQVTGYSDNPRGSDGTAFLYSNREMTRFGGVLRPAASFPTAINDAGQITGYSGGHAFLYSNGVMIDLGAAGRGL